MKQRALWDSELPAGRLYNKQNVHCVEVLATVFSFAEIEADDLIGCRNLVNCWERFIRFYNFLESVLCK